MPETAEGLDKDAFNGNTSTTITYAKNDSSAAPIALSDLTKRPTVANTTTVVNVKVTITSGSASDNVTFTVTIPAAGDITVK